MGLSVTSHGSWRMTCLSSAWVFSSLGRVPLSLSGTWPPATSWLCLLEVVLSALVSVGLGSTPGAFLYYTQA